MSEKLSVPGPTVIAPYLDAVSSIFHPIAHPLINTNNRFAAWKESFGLVQPGTVEGLTREISRGLGDDKADGRGAPCKLVL